MAKNENIIPDANPYLAQYISELNKDLEKLKSERVLLAKSTNAHELTALQLQLIRDQLKDFSNRIQIEPPDVQHELLVQYIDFVVRDHPENQFKLQYHITYPQKSDDLELTLIQKTIYFKLN